jgi:hypothetical protein
MLLLSEMPFKQRYGSWLKEKERKRRRERQRKREMP